MMSSVVTHGLQHAKAYIPLSNRRLGEDSPDISLPRLMKPRQPMFCLGGFAGDNGLQRLHVDRFVLPGRVESRPGTQAVAGYGDHVAREVAQAAAAPGRR